jgi:hypothetical protein
VPNSYKEDKQLANWATQLASCLSSFVAFSHTAYNTDQSLGTWVNKQRSRKHNLNLEHKRRLEEIDFDLNPRAAIDEQKFKKLFDYHGKHGHCELVWAVDR